MTDHWFTRTARGGLGRPATWQGWAVFVLFFVALLLLPRHTVEWWYAGPAPSEWSRLLASMVPIALIVCGYLLIARLKTAPASGDASDRGGRS